MPNVLLTPRHPSPTLFVVIPFASGFRHALCHGILQADHLTLPQQLVPELQRAGSCRGLFEERSRHVEDLGDGDEDAAETQAGGGNWGV